MRVAGAILCVMSMSSADAAPLWFPTLTMIASVAALTIGGAFERSRV